MTVALDAARKQNESGKATLKGACILAQGEEERSDDVALGWGSILTSTL